MIAQADLSLLDSFERALINGRLYMAYQPKVSLTDGTLKRVEALVRWDDPLLGPIPPSRFVPLAERHGLIDELTRWGLRTTLRQWHVWREQGLDTSLAFNISALNLDKLDFPDLVEQMCDALDVPTDRLILELTESATQPLLRLMDTLTRFRIKGMGLALDDFGTGYSTLMQLRQLPFTEVKIDRFFISDLATAKESQLIVRSMIDLAHGLGLVAIAEGVETAEQFQWLRMLNCDGVQGYFVSYPIGPDRMADWFREWRVRWDQLSRVTDESITDKSITGAARLPAHH